VLCHALEVLLLHNPLSQQLLLVNLESILMLSDFLQERSQAQQLVQNHDTNTRNPFPAISSSFQWPVKLKAMPLSLSLPYSLAASRLVGSAL
jgi:hypothetical protein